MKEIIRLTEIRFEGRAVPIFVNDEGQFGASEGGYRLTSSTLSGLKLKIFTLLNRFRKGFNAVPFCRWRSAWPSLIRKGRLIDGEILGVLREDGLDELINVDLLVSIDGSDTTENASFSEFLKLNHEQREEYIKLNKRAEEITKMKADIDEEVRVFRNDHAIDIKELIEQSK